MRHLTFLTATTLLLLTSCGDGKFKESSDPNDSTPIIKDTTNVIENEVKAVDKSLDSITEYPMITNKNVETFLTQYGKENPETKVKVSTQYGDIIIELYKDTPLHRANFIYLVKQQYFDGTFFHRVVPNFIIQGGNSDNVNTPKKRNKLGPAYLLPAEIIPGRNHTYGTVSGAKEYRENPDNRSAPFEFFIFVGPDKFTSHLNGSYTIFGHVIQGMDVAETISKLPADDGEWPKQNVYITAEVID